MKRFALVLLVINVGIWFAGDLWVPDRVKLVASAQNLPRVSTLKVAPVIAEVKSVAADSGGDENPDKPERSAEPVQPICVRLGWFETAEKALDAYRALGSTGDRHKIVEEQRALEPLHWVIIPPQPEERALSLFNDLQRRGIDSYLVTRGENRNAISLGLFQSKQAAERVLDAKKRQNLNAILANFPRNQLSYALVFEVSRVGNADAGDGQAADYQDDFEMVEISRCEGIATTSENP